MGNKIEVDCLHAHLNIEQMDHKHGYIFAEQQQFFKTTTKMQKKNHIHTAHNTHKIPISPKGKNSIWLTSIFDFIQKAFKNGCYSVFEQIFCQVF